jgi:hypothetical protein
VNHFHRQRPPSRENFRCARPRAEKFGKFRLSTAKHFDCVLKHVDWIKARVNFNRPPLRFVYFNQHDKHVEFVALLGSLGRAPQGLDLASTMR